MRTAPLLVLQARCCLRSGFYCQTELLLRQAGRALVSFREPPDQQWWTYYYETKDEITTLLQSIPRGKGVRR